MAPALSMAWETIVLLLLLLALVVVVLVAVVVLYCALIVFGRRARNVVAEEWNRGVHRGRYDARAMHHCDAPAKVAESVHPASITASHGGERQ